MSSPFEDVPSIPIVPDSPSEPKTVWFNLIEEGWITFYLPTEDIDELFRLLKKRASELSFGPNAKYSVGHGGVHFDLGDTDLLAEVLRVHPAIHVNVSDPNDSQTSSHSFLERFYGRAKGKFNARNQGNCTKRSESWDHYNCMADSCPYRLYCAGCYFESTQCYGLYCEHAPLFCCQQPFPSICLHCPIFGSGDCYRNFRNKFERCPLYYY
uniref:DIOX_N domain-containing protein n=1 Tax=Angiostrongylus cantonensis TaxID=6313 RepID=A0A0K0DKN2_ANGCA